MISEKFDNHTYLKDEYDSPSKFARFLDGIYDQFKGENLMLDATHYPEFLLDDALAFLPLSNKHRAEKNSFVIVTDKISYEDAPAELAIAPTLQEGIDLIEMEEIERDLGF